ncbi:MAG: formyltransferase family protein [Planctomycetota bacterium]|nr:formyltransferase family protein [Planctomycetota bacterium]
MSDPEDRILFLGPDRSPLLRWLREAGETVVPASDLVNAAYVKENRITFIISYGYRHILKMEVLKRLPDRAINLHISYLPWNRGTDPNLWSFAEDSPKGVTIHYIDEGIDTGDIIVQRKVEFPKSERQTLATTYEKLHVVIQELFREHWRDIKRGRCPRRRQSGEGSYHTVRDRETLAHLLTRGWDTQVSALGEYAARIRLGRRLGPPWS